MAVKVPPREVISSGELHGCPYGADDLKHFRDTHRMRELRHGSLLWRYYCCGTGDQTLLILPGGERLAELGFPFVAELEGEYRLVYPSYPDDAGLRDMVDGLGAIMDAEGIQRFCVFGASFGGNVAQTLVRAYPERVRGLILATTGVPDRALIRPTERMKAIVRLIPKPLLISLLARVMSAAVPARSHDSAFWRSFLRDSVRSGLTKAGFISLLEATVDFRQQLFSPTDLSEWDRPIAVIQSGQDEVVQAGMRAALIAMYPTAQVTLLKDAGHIAWLTNWDEYIGAMRNLLDLASR